MNIIQITFRLAIENLARFKNFFVFCSIGALCILIDATFYYLLFDLGSDLAKGVSSLLSVMLNYVLNTRMNFGRKIKVTMGRMFSYIMLYIFLIAFNVVVNRVGLWLTNHPPTAFAIAVGFSINVNYLSVKYWFSLQERRVHGNA